jgi:ABC-type antimicrobial peptide transport system permease subunit
VGLPNRLRTVLLVFFAATAVSFACVGLYDTLTYPLRLWRRAVGLRLALGAARSEILKRFLLEGLGVSFLGCVAVGVLAVVFGRTPSRMLYGVSPSDPATLSAVVVLVLIVAAVASMEVLRDE